MNINFKSSLWHNFSYLDSSFQTISFDNNNSDICIRSPFKISGRMPPKDFESYSTSGWTLRSWQTSRDKEHHSHNSLYYQCRWKKRWCAKFSILNQILAGITQNRLQKSQGLYFCPDLHFIHKIALNGCCINRHLCQCKHLPFSVLPLNVAVGI